MFFKEFLSSLVTRAGFSFDEDDNSSYTFDNEYLRHTIDVIIIRVNWSIPMLFPGCIIYK